MDRQRLAQHKPMPKAPRLGKELSSEKPVSSKKQPLSEEERKQLNAKLWVAAGAGNNAKIKRLIKAGADIASKDHLGWTALHIAAWNGRTSTCAFLLEKLVEAGGDVKKYIEAKETEYDTTALMYAAENGHAETCALLIEKGADVNAKCKDDITVLMHAAREGHTEICALLISKGASIEAKSNHNFTALMYAAQFGHSGTCIFLLEKLAEGGGNVKKYLTVTETYGETAVMRAEKEEKRGTAALLKAIPLLLDSMGNESFVLFFSSFRACIGGAA